MLLFLLFISKVSASEFVCQDLPDDPIEFLKKWNQIIKSYYTKQANAAWNWQIDINEENDIKNQYSSTQAAQAVNSLGTCAIQKFRSITDKCTNRKSG